MRAHWQQLLKMLDYKDGDRILDVGGAMDPVPIADVVIDIVNLGRGGKSYCLLDLTSDLFPFDDNSFDIVICSQTLEDLTSPVLAMKEMSRVGKKGIIEVPHRGPESVRERYKRAPYSSPEVFTFGSYHHKWLIEDVDGKIVFTPKMYHLLMRHPIPAWSGPRGVTHKWSGGIQYSINYDIDENMIDENYASFREENRRFWESE